MTRADPHAICRFLQSNQYDLLNKVCSTFDRQADIHVAVRPGLRVKLIGFENPHLLSSRVNNLLRNDS